MSDVAAIAQFVQKYNALKDEVAKVIAKPCVRSAINFNPFDPW